MTNDEMNKLVRKHKSALTRAKNSKDNQKIIEACDKAFADFDAKLPAWPDNWHLWNIAKRDAEYAQARERGAW